jgi:hypothetical protein
MFPLRNAVATVLIVVALLCTAACSTPAIRIARDIEAGVGDLGTGEGARVDISYAPGSWSGGCSGSYTLRIDKGSAVSLGNNNFRIQDNSGPLHVRCTGNGASNTSYHLRFVDVPAPLEVAKARGESAVIEVQRVSGRPTAVGLR